MSGVRLHLILLGSFHLRQDDQPVAGFDHARLQHLLAYLALHRAAPISRQQLAFLFWPDSTDRQALKNLRTSLTRLRHALPDADQFIDVSAQTVQWRPHAPFHLDVAEFEMAVAQAAAAQEAADDAGAESALTAAVAVYTGELLPDCYDDWILPLRERLHQVYGDALERLVLLLEEQREYGNALPYARLLLDHDPMREAAYHHLIRLYLALGDRTEVLRICRACDTMLEREFGSVPVRGTRDVYEHLLEAEDWPAPVAIEQPLETRSASLPLVGRNAECSRLLAAWRAATSSQARSRPAATCSSSGATRTRTSAICWTATAAASSPKNA